MRIFRVSDVNGGMLVEADTVMTAARRFHAVHPGTLDLIVEPGEAPSGATWELFEVVPRNAL